ncbi:hypothetical protein GC170_13530 [bacterium]|nr:hypothetical protein [bacterium]
MCCSKRSGAIAFLVLSIISAASAQTTPRQNRIKPQSFVEAMLSDATLSQRYRSIPDPDRYLADMGNLQERSDDELNTAANDLGKMRRIDGRNWQEIQRARQNSKFRLPLDQPIYVARLYEEANRKQRDIARIDNEENEAFKARFGRGFTMRSGFLALTPREEEMVREWKSQGLGDPYEKRRDEVKERFSQRLQEISTEYRNQTDPGEKYLDQLQREVLSRYERTLVVQRTIQAEIDRRSHVEPPAPEKPNEARQGTLVVSAAKSEFDLKVGEVADVEVKVAGGKPSYTLWVRSQEATIAEMTLIEPGQKSFPVSFPKEGTYTVAISVKDETNPVNEAILNLQFRVTDDKPAEPEKPQPPTKPPGTTRPQDPVKPPAAPPYKPWVLPAGTYQAHLWPGLAWSVHNRKLAKPGTVPPLPVKLTFQADGTFTGTLDWTLPESEKDLSMLRPGASVVSSVKGNLSGKADWTTGKIDWKLEQGKRLLVTSQPSSDGKGIEKSTWTIDYSYEFSGWQFQHPTFGTELKRSLDYYAKKFGPPPPGAFEASGLPKYQADATGKWIFADRGFGGVAANGPSKGRYDTMPGPGGYAKLAMTRVDWVFVYPDRTDTRDDLKSLSQFWAEYSNWFLNILDQAPIEPESPAPTPSQPIKGELAAFGLWPWGELTVKPGEAFELDAMGVFLNDPYDAVKLTDKATWTLPDGLVRGPDGKVKATKPGTYTASVSIKRPDGQTMSDRIRITVK